jgi:hypothetical protein
MTLLIQEKVFILFYFILFLGRLINVKDVDEKEVILKSLKNIALNTKEQSIGILNNFTMNTKILCFLPSNDKTDINIEVGNEILKFLIKVSEKLFDDGKKECIQFRSKLEECDCFNTLIFLLNIYENISFRVRISIILGNLYKYIVIPNKRKIIIDILINYLKEYSNEDKNDKLVENALGALTNITWEGDENRKVVLDGGIITLLLPFVNYSDTNVWQRTVHLLSNICLVKSVDDKNSIISCGIFDVFHKKLLEISLFPPQKMISLNYYSVYYIIFGIDNLLVFNRSGVTSFLKTPLIPLLLHTLDSTISIEDTSYWKHSTVYL